jgi:hypothetical protein
MDEYEGGVEAYVAALDKVLEENKGVAVAGASFCCFARFPLNDSQAMSVQSESADSTTIGCITRRRRFN